MTIPKISDISQDDGLIPSKVAELTIPEEPEALPFLISYYKYNDKLCEIDCGLVKNCQKQALLDLKTVGKKTKELKDFNGKGIDTIPVKYEGEYKKLFSGLSTDIELFEHKLQGTARIFYFVNEIKKIFYIVAITQTHFETEKVRR